MKSLLIALLALASPVLAATYQLTPISTIPVVITAPGHYYFVANLYYTAPFPGSPATAITVDAIGPVVIDMRGFVLQGGQRYEFPTGGATIFPTGILIQGSNVTVENGGITGFNNGISVQGSLAGYFTGINLENVTFINSGNFGSFLNYVNASLVKNCRYLNGYSGAYDTLSQTGNRYVNDTVVNCNNSTRAFTVSAPSNSGVEYVYNVSSK